MARIQSRYSIFALALLSKYVIALPQPTITPPPSLTTLAPSCYTFTKTVPYTGPINCPAIPVTCPPHPDCILRVESVVNVPCPNPKCPATPTVTVTGLPGLECPKCQVGCLTEIFTITATDGCPIQTVGPIPTLTAF